MKKIISNERSEAIELIKESQRIFDHYDFIFKQATGEQSIFSNKPTDGRANTLFPDVLYYEDNYQTKVSLGWELKLPETKIDDAEFINNAKDKANRLNTSVFVLCNFKQVVIYCKNSDNSWYKKKQWDDLIENQNRQDVINNRDKWKKLLLEIIIYLNRLFTDNIVSSAPILMSTKNIAQDISEKYSEELANFYLNLGDRKYEILIKRWYEDELIECNNSPDNNLSLFEKAKLFSKEILLRWINRITFSNLIKNKYNKVNECLQKLLDESISFNEIMDSFNEATKISDFYTIMYCEEREINLSSYSQNVIREYATFLYNKRFDGIEQKEFQRILEDIINISKRELMGLYTTPPNLAILLSKSVISKLQSKIIDPCVGSGTIIHYIMDLYNNKELAHENVWASDKYKLPLQIANMSMTSKDSLSLPNIIFQSDILDIPSLSNIEITDPYTGITNDLDIPKFDYVISNLPFIKNGRLNIEDRKKLEEINLYLKSKNIDDISLKNDWYQFGIIGIERILSNRGTAGIITSNSWLKTKKVRGKNYNYIQTLTKLFNVKKIIISGCGQWFSNADVVTTIMILEKNDKEQGNIEFIKITKDINTMDMDEIGHIADDILIDDIENEYITSISYSMEEINLFVKYGISLNILFDDIKWIRNFLDKTIPMNKIFDILRGLKSTNDKFFYNPDKKYDIEEKYLRYILQSPVSVDSFYPENDGTVFYVRENIEQLKNTEAERYINEYNEKFITKSQKNLHYWYQVPDLPCGDFITSINPERRLFWASVPDNLVINQRFTILKIKSELSVNKKLIHALLNTYFGQIMIESTGFGRALGALDTTSSSIANSLVLDYKQLDEESTIEIINAWDKISKGKIPDTLEQLHNDKWIKYNKLVLKHFKLDCFLEDIVNTLEKSILRRISH